MGKVVFQRVWRVGRLILLSAPPQVFSSPVCYCRCVAPFRDDVVAWSHQFPLRRRGPGKHAGPAVLIGRRRCHGNRVPLRPGPIGREATRRRVRA